MPLVYLIHSLESRHSLVSIYELVWLFKTLIKRQENHKMGLSFGFTYCWLNQFASKVIEPQDLQQDHNQPSSIATIWASFHCLSQRMPYPIFQRQLPSRGVRSSLCRVTIGVQFSSGDIVILTFFGSECGSGVFWTGSLSLSLSRSRICTYAWMWADTSHMTECGAVHNNNFSYSWLDNKPEFHICCKAGKRIWLNAEDSQENMLMNVGMCMPV